MWNWESTAWVNLGNTLWNRGDQSELNVDGNGMMHIDAHQHFWVYDPREYGWIDDSMVGLRRDFLPNDIEPELKQNGFDGCIVVQARRSLEETRWLLELARKWSFILGVVGWVDLCSPSVKSDLQSLGADTKLVGIRYIVQNEPDDRFMLQPNFLRGIAALEEFDLAYEILIYPRQLPAAAALVERFDQQRFVLDHLAKPMIKSGDLNPWKKGIRKFASFPNVYCKLSGLVTEADWKNWTPEQLVPYLDTAFEYFGPKRLMVGSDWPVCRLAASYSRVMTTIKEYLSQYPGDVQGAVLGENARAFWKLQ